MPEPARDAAYRQWLESVGGESDPYYDYRRAFDAGAAGRGPNLILVR